LVNSNAIAHKASLKAISISRSNWMPNVQIKGQPASGLSLSNVGLGLAEQSYGYA